MKLAEAPGVARQKNFNKKFRKKIFEKQCFEIKILIFFSL